MCYTNLVFAPYYHKIPNGPFKADLISLDTFTSQFCRNNVGIQESSGKNQVDILIVSGNPKDSKWQKS
jgi:hypothetical protein